jgi:hypothetical protein
VVQACTSPEQHDEARPSPALFANSKVDWQTALMSQLLFSLLLPAKLKGFLRDHLSGQSVGSAQRGHFAAQSGRSFEPEGITPPPLPTPLLATRAWC